MLPSFEPCHFLPYLRSITKKYFTMQIASTLQNALYFIPAVGTLHHLSELRKLNQEQEKLARIVPLIQELGGRATLLKKYKNVKVFEEIDTLSPALKMRFSNYFEKAHLVNKLGFWGSAVQTIIYLAALAFNPIALCLARVETLHQIYAMYKMCSFQPYYYHYNREKARSELYRTDLFYVDKHLFRSPLVPHPSSAKELAKLLKMGMANRV